MFKNVMMLLGAVSTTMLIYVGVVYTFGTESSMTTSETTPEASGGSPLTIEIENARSDKGVIYAYVYSDATAFSNQNFEKADAILELKVKDGKATTSVDLKPGTYAIETFHDENMNQNFDLNDGVPAEGYSYSRGAGVDDFAKFGEASFELADSGQTESLSMIYY